MSVERLPTRKRRPQPSRSHEEIYELVQRAVTLAEGANHNAAEAKARVDLAQITHQRVETKVDALIKAIGGEGEDERGEKIGTGIVGRLMRLEAQVAKRFALYDGWVKTATGAAAAVAILSGVLWWLLSDRLATLFKGG